MESTTAGDALVRAILNDPDADEPRLVYADWLLERGELRGELIAMQCELYRLKPPSSVPELLRKKTQAWFHSHGNWANFSGKPQLLERRIQALLDGHGRRWIEALLPNRHGIGRAFERGFVAGVALDAEDLVAQFDAMFDAHPIRVLHVRRANGALARAVFANARVAKLRALCIQRPVPEVVVRELATCPRLDDLRELDLSRIRPTIGTVQHLIATDRLRSLETLRFVGNMGTKPFELHEPLLLDRLMRRWGKRLVLDD